MWSLCLQKERATQRKAYGSLRIATYIQASELAAAQVKTANLPLNLAEMAILQVCARMIEESRASGASRRELEKQEGHPCRRDTRRLERSACLSRLMNSDILRHRQRRASKPLGRGFAAV